MSFPLLDIKDLSISYTTRKGEVPAVVDFNLTLYEGETVGLVGESGCGKSTVSLALLNYLGKNGKIVNGSIKFMGEEMLNMSLDRLRQLRGSQISMIYQEPFSALNPCLTVGEQLIEVPMTHENISEQEASERIEQLLVDVRLPDTQRVIQSYPHQLSGGQQQRVVIAMALLSSPKLLLLDEPTTALDVTVEASIVKVVQDISEKYGTSMIYVSHNMGLILNTCERISVMYSGQVIEEGSVKEIFENPRHPYTRGLFHCIPNLTADKKSVPLVPIRGQLPLATARPSGCYFGPRCDFFEESQCGSRLIKISDVDQIHKVRCARWNEINWETYQPKMKTRTFNDIGETILSVKKMQKSYELPNTTPLGFGGHSQKIKAVQDLTFSVRHREIVAIVGESGCGKSTFAKVMLGLEEANAGDVMLGDNDLGAIPVENRSKDLISDVQMVFQNPNDTLNPTQTIGTQIGRSIRKLSNASRSEVEQKIDQLLKLVKLPTVYKHYKPSQLSGGQKQRVAIARAFAGTPQVVIADEPVSALDVSVQAAIINLLLDIQDKNDTTLVFISHDLSLVRYLADRIVVMYLGRVMEQGQTKDIFEPPYHPYTEALLSAVPVADTSIEKDELIIDGELPSPMNPPPGCPFQTRCSYTIEGVCDVKLPPERHFNSMGHNQHTIFCHLDTKTLKKMSPVFRKKHQSKTLKSQKTSPPPSSFKQSLSAVST